LLKRVTANQNALLSQLILKTTPLKPRQSHKTQAKITWCLITIRWNP